MSSRTPVVTQISWLAVIPQLIALGVAVLVAYRFSPRTALLWGAGVFLVYSVASRQLVLRDHRAGIALIKRKHFDAAIPRFQNSLEFLDRHPWIDRFRAIVLMSPSALSYREMALVNVAFCYSQIGRGAQARQFYERCLERFPNSGIASAALRMMAAAAERRDG